jgi:hypothetical protein
MVVFNISFHVSTVAGNAGKECGQEYFDKPVHDKPLPRFKAANKPKQSLGTLKQ